MADKLSFALNIQHAIEEAVRGRIKDLIEPSTDAAVKKLKEEIAGSVDSLALKVMKEYSVMDMGTHIAIHVKKDI